MKFLFAILVGCLLLSGCANNAQINAQRKEFWASVPECHSDRHCELMWSSARRWILNNAGSKLQHITDDYMETYNPRPNSTRIAVRVTREPIASGGYRILVSTWCNNIFACSPNAWSAALAFNRYVSSVKKPTPRRRVQDEKSLESTAATDQQ